MNISYLLVISAAAMWGAIGLFSKIGGHIGFAPMEICFLRSAFAVILLGLFFAVTDRKIFKLEKITDLKYFVGGTGIISFSLNNWAYIESIKETSMGVAAILLYTAPAIIMIISSVLFHEKITKIKVAALILTFMGCVFVTGIIGTENVISVRGFAFGILSAIGYGFYSIFGKIALKIFICNSCILYLCYVGIIFYCYDKSYGYSFKDKCNRFVGVCPMFCSLYIFYTIYIIYKRTFRDRGYKGFNSCKY